MLARQRHDRILELVRQAGSVRVAELTEQLEVSEMTIRRDLDQLDRAGLLERVYGGAAVSGPSSSYEPGFDAKHGLETVQKSRIAAEAATLVRSNSAIGLTAGTTTYRLALELSGRLEALTVVTNSPSIAQVLYHDDRIGTVITGGTRTPSDALVGPLATASIAALSLDVLFLGVHGIDAEMGFTTPNLAESETNREFLRRAATVIVLADHTKWGTRGLSQIAPLSAADIVVTDEAFPVDGLRALDDAGVEVIVANGVERSAKLTG